MGSLNVNRAVADAFYRYKMPRICAKVEGKGNGIKTVIVNMPEVAKALSRPATCEYYCHTSFVKATHWRKPRRLHLYGIFRVQSRLDGVPMKCKITDISIWRHT